MSDAPPKKKTNWWELIGVPAAILALLWSMTPALGPIDYMDVKAAREMLDAATALRGKYDACVAAGKPAGQCVVSGAAGNDRFELSMQPDGRIVGRHRSRKVELALTPPVAGSGGQWRCAGEPKKAYAQHCNQP